MKKRVRVTFCNKRGSNFSYSAVFPDDHHTSTFIVFSEKCLSYNLLEGDLYRIRVGATGATPHRWLKLRRVDACDERVTVAGTYRKLKVTERCL